MNARKQGFTNGAIASSWPHEQAHRLEVRRILATGRHGRGIIGEPREQLALAALTFTHGSQESHDRPPGSIEQQPVGVFTRDLGYQRPFGRITQLVPTGDDELDHPLEARLFHPEDSSTLQMLAKQHAECRWLRRIFESPDREMYSRMHTPGREEQPPGTWVPTQGPDHLPGSGQVDPFDPGTDDLFT